MIEVMGNVESNLIGKYCQSIFSEMLYIIVASHCRFLPERIIIKCIRLLSCREYKLYYSHLLASYYDC